MKKRPPTKTSGKHYHAMVEKAIARTFLDEDVFVENSTYARHNIKRRLIQKSLKPYVCEECGLEGNWNGKPLSLQLDHKNGVNDDHRLTNLRFLCPNCHAQQDTYAGKNIGKKTSVRESGNPQVSKTLRTQFDSVDLRQS